MQSKSITFVLLMTLVISGLHAQYHAVPDDPSVQLDLNGTWKFNPKPEAGSSGEGNLWTEIQVPGEWEMQGFQVMPGP